MSDNLIFIGSDSRRNIGETGFAYWQFPGEAEPRKAKGVIVREATFQEYMDYVVSIGFNKEEVGKFILSKICVGQSFWAVLVD